MAPDADPPARAGSDLRAEVAEGLRYVHARLSGSAHQAGEAAAFVYGLIELLREKGLISVEELDERKNVIAARLKERNRERGFGVLLQEPELDKYSYTEVVTIDCGNRVHLCRAACCKLPFALSRQDLEEGVVRWDLGQPYMIAHTPDGCCSHLDAERRCCRVWQQRPLPCRAYDCRRDRSIWLDFDRRIVNPDIERSDWPRSASAVPDGGER